MYQTKCPLVLSWNYVKNLQSFNDFYLKIGITFDGSVIGHPVFVDKLIRYQQIMIFDWQNSPSVRSFIQVNLSNYNKNVEFQNNNFTVFAF